MKPFFEHLRYSYFLDSKSLVLDIGAFDGKWSKAIAEKYGCRIMAFEPVYEHFAEALCNTITLPNVVLINSAVSATGGVINMGISNNSSGAFSKSFVVRMVTVVRIVPLITILGRIDLIKFNCEGMEFELLDILINSGLHKQLVNIQVQFHECVPEWKAKHKSITDRLSETHEQEWDSIFTWENWKLK